MFVRLSVEQLPGTPADTFSTPAAREATMVEAKL